MASNLASKVLVDTNSLIYSLKHRADIRRLLYQIPEVSGIAVPECVLDELERMSDDVAYARGALALGRSFQSVEGKGPADDCLLEIAKGGGFFILTNDRELLNRATSLGIRTLSFKGVKRIDFS